jgi:hypothetical protein
MAANGRKRRSTSFPNEILVTEEDIDKDDSYLAVNKEVEDLDYNEVGKLVAVYKLVEIKKLAVGVELVSRKERP